MQQSIGITCFCTSCLQNGSLLKQLYEFQKQQLRVEKERLEVDRQRLEIEKEQLIVDRRLANAIEEIASNMAVSSAW